MQVPRVEKHLSPLRGFECADRAPHSAGLGRYDCHNQELLLALRTGSSAALEELQRLYSNRLYRRILSITRNREDAEDALQDTFMRAFLRFDSFRERSHVSTWLTRIAINSALIVIRRRRRAYAEVSLTAPPKPEANFPEFEVRDSAPTPEEVCDLKQRFDKMFSAIERLDPTLRNAIALQITRECSLKEMARTLGLSVPAVKARLHRARKKLAKQFDHRGIWRIAQKERGFELTDREVS